MRNPSHSLPTSIGHGLTADELLALLDRTGRWAGKDPRALAHALATELDALLRPELVAVVLHERGGASTAAVFGPACGAGGLPPAQWTEWLASQARAAGSGRAIELAAPPAAGRLRVAAVGIDGAAAEGCVAIGSSAPAFPGAREELLLEVLARQARLVLARSGRAAAPALTRAAAARHEDVAFA